MIPKSARVKPLACPKCEKVNDAATSPTDPKAAPEEGAVSICFYCAHVTMFTGKGDTLGVRELTPDEEARILSIPEVVETRNMINKFWNPDD